MEVEKTTVVVLYGSQTGTAESEANLIGLQLRERGVKVEVSSCDEFEIEQLPEIKYCLFMVSTTGQGDCCDNMKKFWEFLLISSLPSDSLENLKFSVFGFGDTSYAKYNFMARKLYQRLLQLGGKAFNERGLGDDRKEGGYGVDLLDWKKKLFTKLGEIIPGFNPTEKAISGLLNAPSPTYQVIEQAGKCEDIQGIMSYIDKNREASKVVKGKLAKKERMTAIDHFQDVEHLTIDFTDDVNYSPGDVAVIFPQNPLSKVDFMLDYFNLKPESPLSLKLKGENIYSLTAKQLFSSVLRIAETPSFFFFKLLAFYTDIEIYQTRIDEMKYDEYYKYAVQQKRDICEILFDFKGIKMPLDIFVSFLGFLKPREYSISSSQKAHPKAFTITVAIVEYETVHKRSIVGICSNYFKKLATDEPVHFRLEKGTLAFPEDRKSPVIMVGPGTGVAPFISFLEERALTEEGLSRHNHYLFFGNRFEAKDFLHKDFLLELRDQQKLTLKLAFSRDQEDKNYVQHVMSESSFRLSLLFKSNIEKIKILIAGNSKYMPQGVKRSIKEILKQIYKEDEAVDEQYEKMEANKQIVFETWG